MSASSKGNYYKLKTKKWFEDLGYQCEYLERYQRIFAKGKVFNIKRDLFASDGLSIKSDQIVFWQSKLGSKNVAQAVKEFNKFKFPPSVELWIIVWEPRKKEPEIIPVKLGEGN